MHRPIFLKDISLSFPSTLCFDSFSAQVFSGNRIAIIGRNGSGKSSLLKMLSQQIAPSSGEIIMPGTLSIGYVEQTITDCDNLSGGQRFNKRLSEALLESPDLLLLDEPTNHLDKANRQSLMKMLARHHGTLIIVTHDTELLRHCIDTLWRIDNKRIHTFTGSYDDYMCDISQRRSSIEKEILSLKRETKDMHHALMKEQSRAKKSKAKGQKSIDQRKWPTVTSNAKALRAEKTSGKKKASIDRTKHELTDQLASLSLPDIILPSFSLTSENISSKHLLSISHANIGYCHEKIILNNISFSLNGKERIAINGKNASGKSTLLKAILGEEEIIKTGNWHLPQIEHIGYLDQHYSNLNPSLSVIEHLTKARTDWNDIEARQHLSHFLFRKNEEIIQLASTLSGGEKARLSLSLIAAKTPRLLILDEITNNLDLETKEHVIQVLREYPGAMIIVSHDDDFIEHIGIDFYYTIKNSSIFFK